MHKDDRAERKETSPGIKWELEIEYVDVCYAAQHEPETAGMSNIYNRSKCTLWFQRNQ